MSEAMIREPMLITALVFFILVVGIVFLLVVRRSIIGRFLKWRLAMLDAWGETLDRIIARMDEPYPAEINYLTFTSRFTQEVLSEVLLSRMDLLVGNSRMPLIRVFEQTGLLNLSLIELKGKKVWKRRHAADNLGRGARRDVSPHLVEALGDPDPEVQAIAARSLGKLGIQTAAPYMVSLFASLPDDICVAVADSLIDLGQSTLEPLADALNGDSESSRYFSALTVSHICEEGRCRIEIINAMPRRRATDVVPAHYPSILNERLLLLLTDKSARVRKAAIEALASLQDFAAVPSLQVTVREDPVPGVRAAAARALGIIKAADSRAILVEALNDPVWEVEYAASRALVAHGDSGSEALKSLGHEGTRAWLWLPEIAELVAESSR
jgi:hypothetical protein